MTTVSAEICNEYLSDQQMIVYLSGYGVKLYRGDVDVLENDINTPVREDAIENGKVMALYKLWLKL